MRYLIKPCLLIQVGLSLLVNKNQIHESDKVVRAPNKLGSSSVLVEPAMPEARIEVN